MTRAILRPHWNSSLLFCCFPVSWRSCSFASAGLALFTCSNSSQMMKIWGCANSKPWISDWMVAELVIPLGLPSLHQQDQISSLSSFRPLKEAIGKRQGQFSYSHALRADSPIFTPPESASLWLRAHSSKCCTSKGRTISPIFTPHFGLAKFCPLHRDQFYCPTLLLS